MAQPTDGLGFREFRVLLFHHSLIFLLLIQSSAGKPQVIGPSQPIVATVGDDIILPCYLNPAADPRRWTVEWTRPDLDPKVVHVAHRGVEQKDEKQHPSYRGRTSLFTDELKYGDISLKLSKVNITDEGTYRCSISSWAHNSSVELVVRESQVIDPAQEIVATVGDDIILPCSLEAAVDASYRTVEWTRPDLDPRFVHVERLGSKLESNKHPSYRGRTSLFADELKHGDISLHLSKVKPTDEGTYRCSIPSRGQSSLVALVVDVVSSPAIVGFNKNSSGLVLQCESEGWHSEPEVLWLDGEGHVLSAGPTETVRGPDGLYTVSSRVTVEERHGNNFTCRVQQKNINQIREARICATEDVGVTSVSVPWIIVFSVTVGFTVIALVICLLCIKMRLRN